MNIHICDVCIILFGIRPWTLNWTSHWDPVNVLSLIPVNTFIANKFVWNVLTCAFYEKYFIKILLDCFLLITTIQPLEIASYEQFALYILICILVTSFSTSAIYFISFFVSKFEAPLVQPTIWCQWGIFVLVDVCPTSTMQWPCSRHNTTINISTFSNLIFNYSITS